MSRRKRRKSKVKPARNLFRNFLLAIGAFAVLALVSFGIEALYAFHLAEELLPSASYYAEVSGRAILNADSQQQLENVLTEKLSPKTKAAFTKSQAAQMYATLSTLGKFEYYNGIYGKGKYGGFVDLFKGPTVRYTLTANAIFEEGFGIVTMVVIRSGSDWQISACNITTTASTL